MSTVRIPDIKLEVDTTFSKLRAICRTFNQIYEFNEIKNKHEYELFKAILPLFEG